MKFNLVRKLFPRSLKEAAEVGNESALRRYLRGDVSQAALNNSLLASIKAHHLDLAIILFEQGADINARDPDGYSALHFACARRYYSAVQWLVDNGADVNATNNHGITHGTGHTPLFEAAARYDYRLAKFLLNAGADPNVLSPDGSPLHRACSQGNGYTDETFKKYGGNIVSLLLEYGGDPNLRQWLEGKTPLHEVMDNPLFSESYVDRYLALISLLLEYGADPTMEDNEGKCQSALKTDPG